MRLVSFALSLVLLLLLVTSSIEALTCEIHQQFLDDLFGQHCDNCGPTQVNWDYQNQNSVCVDSVCTQLGTYESAEGVCSNCTENQYNSNSPSGPRCYDCPIRTSSPAGSSACYAPPAQNLTVVEATYTTITVSFNQAVGRDGNSIEGSDAFYVVHYRPVGDGSAGQTSGQIQSQSGSLQTTLTGLQPNTTYEIGVETRITDVAEQMTPFTAFTMLASTKTFGSPARAPQLVSTNTYASNPYMVQLLFGQNYDDDQNVELNGGAVIQSYIVTVTQNKTIAGQEVPVLVQTKTVPYSNAYNIQDLAADTLYSFSYVMVNAQGFASPSSNVLNARTHTVRPLPSDSYIMVNSRTTTPISSDGTPSVSTVVLSVLTSDFTDAYARFIVAAAKNSSDSVYIDVAQSDYYVSYTIQINLQGLKPVTNYTVSAFTYKTLETGVSSVTQLGSFFTIPGKPRPAYAVAATAGSVTIAFDTGVPSNVATEVQMRPTDQGSLQTVTSPYVLTGLSADSCKDIIFRVHILESGDYTDLTDPGTVCTLPASPQLAVQSQDTNQVGLSVSHTDAASFRIYIDGAFVIQVTRASSTQAVTLTNLQPGRKYSVEVAAVGTSGRVSTNSTIQAITVASAVGSISQTTTNSSSVSLSWSPAQVDNDPIALYRINFATKGSASYAEENTTSTTIELNGLGPSQTYDVIIVPLSVSGVAGKSSASQIVTCPAAPVEIYFTNSTVSFDSFSLYVTSSPNIGDVHLDYVSLEYSESGQTSQVHSLQKNASSTNRNTLFEATGLKPSTMYTLQASVSNKQCWSSKLSGSIKTIAAPLPTVSVPAPSPSPAPSEGQEAKPTSSSVGPVPVSSSVGAAVGPIVRPDSILDSATVGKIVGGVLGGVAGLVVVLVVIIVIVAIFVFFVSKKAAAGKAGYHQTVLPVVEHSMRTIELEDAII